MEELIRELRRRAMSMASLDTPEDQDAVDIGADLALGFVPVVGTAQAGRDFERARRDNDKLGMVLSAAAGIPVVGGVAKAAGTARKGKAAAEETVKALRKDRMLGFPPDVQRGQLHMAEKVQEGVDQGVRGLAAQVQSFASTRGLPTSVSHSTNAAGRSSYITIGGTAALPESITLRVSDHGVGPRRYEQDLADGVTHVQDEQQMQEAIAKFITEVDRRRTARAVGIAETRAQLGITENAAENRKIEQRRFSKEGIPVDQTRREAGLNRDGTLQPISKQLVATGDSSTATIAALRAKDDEIGK